MKFFNDCKTLDEVKALYKKLALEHHPDRGGDTATMQAINAEYAFVSARIAKGAGFTQEETDREMNFSQTYQQVLEKIIHLPGIVIEQVGLWIWVTGNTRPVCKELKAAGLLYASKKQAWYYRSEDLKELRGGRKSLDEIRHKYGSEVIRADKRKALHYR